MDDRTLQVAFQAIRDAEALLITAGAGMGVDSGLPDFRGTKGFWRAYPPLGKLGLAFEDMASPRWFDRNPALAWGFYGHRLGLYRNTIPHNGFSVLLRMAQRMSAGAFVYTSNVDGQFQRAGFPKDRLVECHGSIHHLQCAAPCHEEIWRADGVDVPVDEATFLASGPLPQCPKCGGMARPNILMFGDPAWVSRRSEEQQDRLVDWMSGLGTARLVVVELGAGMGPSVRGMSERVAAGLRGRLVRINAREAQVPEGQIGVEGPAMATLERLEALLGE